MGLFRQNIDTLPTQTGIKLGDTVRTSLVRDYPREGIIVRLTGTITTAAATESAFGCYDLIKRLRLYANDGGQQRTLVDCYGPALMIRHVKNNGQMPFSEAAATALGSFQVTFPILFPPQCLNSPTYEMFLQNFPRFNSDPVLEIDFGAQSDVDVNATPTFAISAGITLDIYDLKREVSVPTWNFLQTELVTVDQPYSSNGNQIYQLPVPGFHFYAGVISFSGKGTVGDITDGKNVTLNILNTTLRNTPLTGLALLNQLGDLTANSLFYQSLITKLSILPAFWDFLTDQTGTAVVNLDTLLNTYPFTQLGTGPVLKYNITGGATDAKLTFIHERCFGDISAALALSRLTPQSTG